MTDGENSSCQLGAVYRDVLEWGITLPSWQQELIRRLVRDQELSPGDVEELAESAVAELEQQNSQYQPLSLADFPAVLAAESGRSLRAIKEMQNVNVLRPDQTLTFGAALTVVYGDNGSGKSGYARVLKKVYRARVVEDILGDLSSDEPSLDSASATFVLEGDSGEETQAWTDNERGSDFGRFAVLDSPCSANYVQGGPLDVGPAGIDVPRRFADALDRVKKHLGSSAQAIRPTKEALKGIPESTVPGAFVGALSESTTEAEVARQTRWSNDSEKELASLRREISESSEQTLAARQMQGKARLKAVESLGTRIKGWNASVGDDVHERVLGALRALRESRGAAETIRGIATDAVPLDALSGGVWPQLLRAAADFVSTVRGKSENLDLTVGDEKCALCWQPLDSIAKARFRAFLAHLEGTAAQSRQQAEAQLQSVRDRLATVPSRLTPEDEALLVGESAELPPFSAMLATIGQRKDLLLSLASGTEKEVLLPDVDDTPLAALRELHSRLQVNLKSLPQNDEEVRKRLTELGHKRDELMASKRVTELRDEIIAFVSRTREYQRFKNAEASINTRKASAKAADLHSKHMTERYRNLVDEELSELRFKRRRPTLAQKTSKARVEVTPLVSAELKNISPERVFSEGERTSIALACFLAELRLGNDSTGLIFDDPVSSLDHNVREHVARRLVAAAKGRQVIVFTHDLAFLADLREQARKIQGVECEFRTLFATDYHSGFVELQEPFGARTVKKRIKALRQLITDAERAAKNGEVSKLENLTRTFYDDLRRTWERFVEERLFAAVVSRLERNVTVGALAKVPFTKELGETVHEGWRRCSNAIEAHDHADAAGRVSHSVEEMKSDFRMLENADKACPVS